MTDKNTAEHRPWALRTLESRSNSDLLVTASSLFVALCAFVFNMGWIRIMLLFSTLPFLLFGAEMMLGLLMYFKRLRARAFNVMRLCHPLTYVLMQDHGDSEPGYIFFGLVDLNGGLSDLGDGLMFLAILALMASVISPAILLKQLWSARKRAL